MNLKETKIKSDSVYDGQVVKLSVDSVSLPNGETGVREVITHVGGCCAVAIDSDKNVLLVTQYRYPMQKEITELPAGKLNPGEHHSVTAKRELEEETGCTAKNWHYLGFLYPSVGYTNEIIHIYLADDLSYTKQSLDSDEFLNVSKIAFDKAVQMALCGELNDSKTVIALLRANDYINNKNQECL